MATDEIKDIQFHSDKQGLDININLMYKDFNEKYIIKYCNVNNTEKKYLNLKDKETWIINNIWEVIESKCDQPVVEYQIIKVICSYCDENYNNRLYDGGIKILETPRLIMNFNNIKESDSHGVCEDCMPKIYEQFGLEHEVLKND